jgi:hypothetical protein
MSHTPGPWEYRDRMVIGGPRSSYVCEVSGAASNAEHQADARLIAAAPALLEALAGCIEHMEWSTPQGKDAHAAAIAALRQAAGG